METHPALFTPVRLGAIELAHRVVMASLTRLRSEPPGDVPGPLMAEGDYVILHGRFSGFGLPVNWVVADILRIEDGVLVEHWDVIQDEATQEQSKSGRPMFGDSFPMYR